MKSIIGEVAALAVIFAGVWIAAGLGPALIVVGALALILVEVYGIGGGEALIRLDADDEGSPK